MHARSRRGKGTNMTRKEHALPLEETLRLDKITNDIMAICAAMGISDTQQLAGVAVCLMVKIVGHYDECEREDIYQEFVFGLRITLEKNGMLKPMS